MRVNEEPVRGGGPGDGEPRRGAGPGGARERVRIGVQLQPEHTDVETLRAVWHDLDTTRVDSLWLPDHFFPVSGAAGDDANLECWTLLAAIAATTSRIAIGTLVSCVAYRNPDLLADMARTTSLLSGGRLTLGLGAGWCERDFVEYGYPFADSRTRVRDFGEALPRITARLAGLRPPATGMRLLIGGGGPVMLRLTARYADAWNGFGPPEEYARRVAVLDESCRLLGRDPMAIERTVYLDVAELARAGDYVAAGAQHVIVGLGAPFDLGPVRDLIDQLDSDRVRR